MMKKRNHLFTASLLLVVLLLTACSVLQKPADTPTPAPTATTAPTETAEPSATPTETATSLPTETPLPTQTPLPPLAVLKESVTGWCLPIDLSFAASAGQDGAAPQGARVGAWMYDQFNLQIPATSCTLVIAFNQAAPAGLRLQYINETNAPWLDLELTPASANPTSAWAAMTQTGIINPPAWEVTYTVRVVGPDGSELFKQPVRFFKATPNPCWDGSLPDPVTLYCPNWDGDWNYRDFPNCNPNADIFQGNPPPGCGEGE